MPEKDINYDVLSQVKFLSRSAMVFPDKVAVIYGDTRFHTRNLKTGYIDLPVP